MKFTDDELLSGTLARDFRAVARLITRIEAGDPKARALAAGLRRPKGRAHVVGVTGSPGAGKSTLVDVMAQEYRKQGLSVANAQDRLHGVADYIAGMTDRFAIREHRRIFAVDQI